MMLRVALAATVAAAVLLAWGFVFWAVLPITGAVVHSLPAAGEILPPLKKNVTSPGVYLYPAMPEDSSADAWNRFAQDYRQGPLVHLFFRPKGDEPLGVPTYAQGFLQYFLTAFLAGTLVWLGGAAMRTFARRWAVVVVAGVMATIYSNLGQPIWLAHPWDYHGVVAVYEIIGALAMGVVVAAIVVPPRATPVADSD